MKASNRWLSLCRGLIAAVFVFSFSVWGQPHRHNPKHRSTHAFKDVDRWAKVFDDPERVQWQKPEAVLDLIGLASEMVVADIGAGTGYFAVRLAKRVPRGRVWGVDTEQNMVDYLDRRATKFGLRQLKGVKGGAADPRLPEAVDVAFLCNTYHHITQRVAYFRRLAKQLKPGGKLVIVDFNKKGKIPVGPPEPHRISARRVQRELMRAGYRRLTLDRKTLPYQYVAIYRLADAD